jgi:hypothetical protein
VIALHRWAFIEAKLLLWALYRKNTLISMLIALNVRWFPGSAKASSVHQVFRGFEQRFQLRRR